TFSEAISLLVNCETQKEVDYFWDTLSQGGEEGPCGWLKDRYGLSWQIVPSGFEEMMSHPDKEKVNRAFQAMLQMKKLDLEEVRPGAQPEEREKDTPSEPNGLRAVQGAVQPASGGVVSRRLLVHGVQEDVGVDDLHAMLARTGPRLTCGWTASEPSPRPRAP